MKTIIAPKPVEPSSDDKLWRYMNLAKFISLLSTRKLYFASIDSFEDVFEGAYSTNESREAILAFNRAIYLHNKHQKCHDDDFEGCSINSEAETAKEEKIIRVMNVLMERTGKLLRRSTYVNCWHLSENESDAMWKLYSSAGKDGIAIQTTYNNFKIAISSEVNVKVRKVQYIDYLNTYADIEEPYWYKRKSFEYENEVRALIAHTEYDLAGLPVPVDLEKLIENIYVSPYAPPWYFDVVKSVLDKFEVHKKLKCSVIRQAPYYFSRAQLLNKKIKEES